MPQNNPYQKFLVNKHTQFNTPTELLNKMVLESVNSPISKLDKIIQGETNEVYSIITESKENFIIRISRRDDRNFEPEKWAQIKCSEKGIPVAEISAIKHLTYKNEPLSICLMSKLPGVTLDNRPMIDPDADQTYLKKICQKAGFLLSQMHSIRTSKFGDLNANGEGEHLNFLNLFEEKIPQKKLFLETANKHNISKSIIEQIFLELEQNLPSLDFNKSVLVHNDFGPKHIMVDGEKITGIIDFGEAKAGHPIQDFATWDFWYAHQIPTEILMEKYTNKDIFNSNYKQILKSIVFLNYLNTLYHYDQEENPHMVQYVTKLLNKYL